MDEVYIGVNRVGRLSEGLRCSLGSPRGEQEGRKEVCCVGDYKGNDEVGLTDTGWRTARVSSV